MPDSAITFSAPRGMRDFYPEDMALRNRIFGAWRAASELYGFQPYDACVVETLDLLKRKSGEEIVEQIYAFQDKSGRDLALRPEMTPTLARMVSARQGGLSFPLKWFAIPQCFRYERMTRGRKREHYQWNLDIVGEPSAAAEVEVIAAAVRALALLGLGAGDFNVHFSSRALLAGLLVSLGIPRDHHPAAFLALDKKGKIPDDEIAASLAAAGLAAAGVKAAMDLLGIESMEQAIRMAGSESQACESLRQFRRMIDSYGMADRIRFDISVIRGLSYYTGIVFEAFDAKRQFRAIFGGGRYDDLLSQVGGRPATGVGLGFGDVVIAEILTERTLPAAAADTDITVGYMQEEQRLAAMAAARAWRDEGKSVDLSLSPEKARSFFARAGKGRFREAVYIGPDDVAAGRLRVKDLATHAEREVALDALAGSPSGK